MNLNPGYNYNKIMNQIDLVNEKENSSPHNNWGHQLQVARIKQGISIEDVAARMNLRLEILQSIENNHLDDITAPIFVKGYLRTYARLLSLDEEKIIQCYVEFSSNQDPPISINTTGQMALKVSTRNARIKWMAYLVVIALLSAWWWNTMQNKPEVVVSLDADPSITEVIIEPIVVEAESSNLVETNRSEIVAVGIEPLEEEGSASMPLVESQAVIVESNTETNTVAPDVVVESIFSEVLVNESTRQASTPTFDTDRTAPVGSDLLDIIVNEDTWAEIKDANDYVLAYDLWKPNSRLQITGQAPFSAFLGNGYGVEIFINSESVDIVSHIQNDNNTVKLTIGTN